MLTRTRQTLLLLTLVTGVLSCRPSTEAKVPPVAGALATPPTNLSAGSVHTSSTVVFVTASDVRLDEVFVIDARGNDAEAPYLPGAHPIDWSSLRDGWFRTGRLDNETELRVKLSKLGVRSDTPVLVYGAWDKGWGEEGRIWWTLRYLGHTRVQILEGGIRAWSKSRGSKDAPADPAPQGSLRTKPNESLRIDKLQLQEALSGSDFVLLDARRSEEFAGETPYHAARGGHVPGAHFFPWRGLINEQGLKDTKSLQALFLAAGVRPNTAVASYCTAGVRSAFVVAVMHHVGFTKAANYDGSWWEWAADDDLPVAR